MYPAVGRAFEGYRSQTARRLRVVGRRGQGVVLVGDLRAPRSALWPWRFRRLEARAPAYG